MGAIGGAGTSYHSRALAFDPIFVVLLLYCLPFELLLQITPLICVSHNSIYNLTPPLVTEVQVPNPKMNRHVYVC
jgi:hypothetical protein